MADQNTYLRYKHDQKLLVYWIIHASNKIIKSFPSQLPATINTTGQISLATLISLSELIGKHIKPIPTKIYSLFQSVIAARTETHTLFQQIVSSKPDPDVEKSNVSHKHWIDGLEQAFRALGGDSWKSRPETATSDRQDEDDEDFIFQNKFAGLNLGEEGDMPTEENEDSSETEEPSVVKVSVQPKPNSNKKGKKGKRGRKGKAKKKLAANAPSLEEVPLESYRIIEDEDGVITDYLMAVYSLVQQWVDLRQYLQRLWSLVAYEGLNSAVAGAASCMALKLIKKTESMIFVDFPGHDSFETVMKTTTRGDPDKAQGMFHLALHQIDPNGLAETVQTVDVDVKEQFFVHTYRDLLDFVTDFQKTRSGKPTKPIHAEIQDWNPSLNLERASEKQRLKWRRAYTINWLYDLVNLFSSIVVQRRTMKGQSITLETVDWSTKGPWNQHRRLYGLNEFAGEITSLAMQKPGTDVRKKILPHHVFQLQCIVDSMTVSRGWSLEVLNGHVLRSPSTTFRPRRDVDLFMDRDNDRLMRGFCMPVGLLNQLFEQDAMIHGDPTRHRHIMLLLEEMLADFVDWLGETKYMHGLTTIPPSRFSNTNSNGLWEYSPYLCGVDLMEALELAYAVSMHIWDKTPEPICIVHLYNMLLHEGYIERSIGLLETLKVFFQNSFFHDGIIPESNFGPALTAISGRSRSERFQEQSLRRHMARTTSDIHGLLSVSGNKFFKTKSSLGLYREADWDHTRIPDSEVPLPSYLFIVRAIQTKQVTDPAIGRKRMDDTELVERARAKGMDDATMMQIAAQMQHNDIDPDVLKTLSAKVPEGYTVGTEANSRKNHLSDHEILNLLSGDIASEVCGERAPVLSLNYIAVTANLMVLFQKIEDKLRSIRYPMWVEAYEKNPALAREKRASLTALILADRDEECLKLLGEIFEDFRSGFMDFIYWEDLDEVPRKSSHDQKPLCTVM